MSLISVRKLNAAGDPMRGNGLSNFLTDIDAVGQIISTTIKLLQGEWWENTTGTPLFQSLLGHPITSQGVALILRARILSVPYVTGIQTLDVVYGRAGRTFAFSTVVNTQVGAVTVYNLPLGAGTGN